MRSMQLRTCLACTDIYLAMVGATVTCPIETRTLFLLLFFAINARAALEKLPLELPSSMLDSGEVYLFPHNN
jgi:hypothetical protein